MTNQVDVLKEVPLHEVEKKIERTRKMKDDGLYRIKRWGEGYFDVNALGHVVVKPNRKGEGGDLYELMKSLVDQGIDPPILIRFNGIIRDRVQYLSQAFQTAIKDLKYSGSHRMVYPIKVNPQRHVVEIVQQAGQNHLLGFEVGSKPELIAVLALEGNPDRLLLCNGYKDAEYVSLALMASKLGRRTLIIIEQAYELKLVLDAAKELGIEAEIGFRMKLSNKGTGRWESSGGESSKFGLFTHEIVAALDQLEKEGKSHWLKLLHFHMGSQITSIESIKKALKEGSRMYTELAKEYPSLVFFDVGGGLAVDYDGSKSITDSSMNYSLREYARDVIMEIGSACKAANVQEPTIITESGRAIASYHSVLIVEVIDVTSNQALEEKIELPSQHGILAILSSMEENLNLENCVETFHNVMELKDRILEEFVHGKMTLKERAAAEKMYRSLLVKVNAHFKQLSEIPEESAILNKMLLETYFCNFSVFQSLTDSWAIGQLFPLMPIHRLNEGTNHQAILADLTCDSDGKIDQFIAKKQPERFIPLHPYTGEPYYVGIFLVGAYQEILGGLHNLFGDTNVVHAELNSNGKWEISRLVEGDTIEEVLHYVQYNTENLLNQLHLVIESSLKNGRISFQDAAKVKKKFKQALESYTYLIV